MTSAIVGGTKGTNVMQKCDPKQFKRQLLLLNPRKTHHHHRPRENPTHTAKFSNRKCLISPKTTSMLLLLLLLKLKLKLFPKTQRFPSQAKETFLHILQ